MGMWKQLDIELQRCEEYVIKQSVGDGKYYAVFRSEFERNVARDLNPKRWGYCQPASFGAPDNALELPAWWRIRHPFQFERNFCPWKGGEDD